MNNNKTVERLWTTTLDIINRFDLSMQDAFSQKAWFAGLYFASLFCLTATAASVRWVLYSI